MIKSQNLIALVAAFVLSACDRNAGPSAEPTSAPKVAAAQPSKYEHKQKSDSWLLDQAVSSGQTLDWMKTLKALHPEQYQRLNDKLTRVLAGSTDEAANRLAMAKEAEPFLQERKRQLVRAPDRELREYMRLSTIVAERLLTENAQACTDVFQGRLDPKIQLPDDTWAAMSAATEQLLVAAREAELHPQDRPLSPIERADIVEWRNEMQRRGAAPEMFAILSDPARRAAASPVEICETRIAMMDAAQHLRPALTAKIVLALNPVQTGRQGSRAE